MPTIFQDAGLLGAEIPLTALGGLLLLVFYRRLRDEPFLRSWMISEFSQTAFLSGTLFLLFHKVLPTVPHVIRTAILVATFLIGGLGPLFLFRGFREATGRPVPAKIFLFIFVPLLGCGIILVNTVLRVPDVSLLRLTSFADLAMASSALYITIVGSRAKATRVLAVASGLKLLSLLPKLSLAAALASHPSSGPSVPDPPASVYLWILLFQAATSGMIILGMVDIVDHKHQRIRQTLDQTMEQLTAANLELDHLAGIDPLTNLANRRSLERHLAIEWRRAVRSKQDSVSIIAIDVDHFKELNDTHGHPAGDDYLKLLASVLKETFRREEDLVARVGGDEFIALLAGIDADAAQGLAERARAQMEALTSQCTLSIGCSTVRPTQELRPEALLHRADEALYRAKHNGRNQVSFLSFL